MAGELAFSEELRVEREDSRPWRVHPLPYQLILLIFLWLELFFGTGCVATLMGIAPDTRILLAGGAVCGIFWLCFYRIRKRFRYVLLAVYLAVTAFLFFYFLDLVRDGWFTIANASGELIYNYYKVSIGYYWDVETEKALCTAVFLVFAIQVAAACHAWTLFRARGAFFSSLILAAVALSGLAVGIVQEGVYFIGAIFCALFQSVLASRYPEYLIRDGRVMKMSGDNQKRCAKTALFFGVLATLLAIVVSRAIDPDTYRNKMGMREKKQQLQQEFDKLAAMPVWKKISGSVSDMLGLNVKGQGGGKDTGTGSTTKLGGLNSGVFSRAGKVVFENVAALVVTLPEMDCAVYLKGYTGARYTDTGWKELLPKAVKEYGEISGRHGLTAQGQGYQFMELFYNNQGPLMIGRYQWGDAPVLQQGNMKVEYVTANKRYVYMPYYVDPAAQGGCRYGDDGYLYSRHYRDYYDFDFYMPSQEFLYYFANYAEQQITKTGIFGFYKWQKNERADTLQAFEGQYREFVYQYYTELPEGHEELKGLLPKAENTSVAGKIKAVQEYLAGYEYTLSPGEMPKDADFVNYFLFENKKGYCVHFASSAVLMLRSLGVPARYAEGYLVTKKDIAEAKTSRVGMLRMLSKPYSSLGSTSSNTSTQVVMQKRVEVRDYMAHAWVEVYRDELGWVPIEVTSGYTADPKEGSRPTEHEQAVAALPSPTPVPERLMTPTPFPTDAPTNTPFPSASPSQTPTDKPVADGTPTPGMAAKPTGTGTTPGGEPSTGQDETKTLIQRLKELPGWAKMLFGFLLCAVCAILILLLRCQVVWNYRTKKKTTRKNKVLWYYLQMERLLSQQGIAAGAGEDYESFAKRVARTNACVAGDFVRCQQTALMAGFGRGQVTPEDTAFLGENYQKLREDLFHKASRARYLYLKFIKLY